MVSISNNLGGNYPLNPNGGNRLVPQVKAEKIEAVSGKMDEFEMGDDFGVLNDIDNDEPDKIWPFISNFLNNFGFSFDPLSETNCNSEFYHGRRPNSKGYLEA